MPDVDTAWLEELTGKLPAASHADALGWLEARLNLKSLLSQVEQSTGADCGTGQGRQILFLHGPIADAGGGHP